MLTREKILDAVLTVLEEDGPDGISMRKLAKRLDVTATAIYHHFDGREALLEAVVDEIGRRIVAQAPQSGTWQERLSGLMAAMVDQALAHPRAALWTITTYARRVPFLGLHDAIFAILLEAGFPADTADRVKGAVMRAAIGHLVLAGATARDWTEVPADLYPHLHAVESARHHADQAEHFRFTLHSILAGVGEPT